MQACFQRFVHNICAPTAAEVASNDEVRYLKISVHFQILYLQNEFGDPINFCISETSSSLTIRSRRFIKLSMLEDFREDVIKSFSVCGGTSWSGC